MFIEYLRKLNPRSDTKGDFIRLAVVDPQMQEVATRQQLQTYMAMRKYSDSLIDGGEAVWKDYETVLRKAALAPSK